MTPRIDYPFRLTLFMFVGASAALHGIAFSLAGNGTNTTEYSVSINEGVNSIPVSLRSVSRPTPPKQAEEVKEKVETAVAPSPNVISNASPDSPLSAPPPIEPPDEVEFFPLEQIATAKQEPKSVEQPHEKEPLQLEPSAESAQQEQAESSPSLAQQQNTGADVNKPRATVCPPPPYPPEALREGREGIVRLSVIVSKDGRARNIRLIQSSGHRDMDRSAILTVRRKWRFSSNDTTVQTEPAPISVEVKFRING